MSNHNRPNNSLNLFFGWVDRQCAIIEEFIMATGIILIAINTIINVISRFIFNHSIIFSEELNSIFILMVTFAGISYAARHVRHIRMTAIYDHLPNKLRKFLMIMITAITALLMLFLAWYAVEYIINMASKNRVYPALGIPVWISYLWVPVGFFITAIQYLLTLIKNLQEKEIYLSSRLNETDAREAGL